jgi:site-specific recombinase XerD
MKPNSQSTETFTSKHAKTLTRGLYQRNQIYWLRYSKAGKQERKSLNTTDLAEAIATRKRELETIPTIQSEGVMRTAELYLQEQLKLGNLKERSVQAVKQALVSLLRNCPVARLDDITPQILQAYFNRITQPKGKGGMAASSWNSYAGHLSGFFSGMVRSRRLGQNPMTTVTLPKFNQAIHARTHVESKETANRLIANCTDPRIKFVLLAGFHLGMRKEEIIESRWEWMREDLKVAVIPMEERKRPKPATPPLPASMIAHLKFMRAALPRPPSSTDYILMPSKTRGDYRYRWDFRKPLEDYLKTQGCNFRAHDMRRSYVTNLCRANVSLDTISAWVGDSVRTLEAHYKHLQAYDSRIEKLTR